MVLLRAVLLWAGCAWCVHRQKQSRAFATTGAVDVSVISHQVQEYAVWFGGSIVASTPSFPKVHPTLLSSPGTRAEGPELKDVL